MMAKRIILLVALAALLGATATEAVTPGKGKKGRKYFRHSYYVANLQNDKLAGLSDGKIRLGCDNQRKRLQLRCYLKLPLSQLVD